MKLETIKKFPVNELTADEVIHPYEKEAEVVKKLANIKLIKEQLDKKKLRPLKEVLNHLYWKRLRSIRSIADIFGVGYSTVRNWMMREGISKRAAKLPEVWKPAERKFPTELDFIGETKVKVAYWVPDLDDTWLMGFAVGDGSAHIARWKRKPRKRNYIFSVGNKNYEILTKAIRIMKKHGSPWLVYKLYYKEKKQLKSKNLRVNERDKANYWEVAMGNIKLFTAISNREGERDYDNIGFFLADRKRASKFLQGFADAEGSVVIAGKLIAISNADRHLVKMISKALSTHFGIQYEVRWEWGTRYWERDNIKQRTNTYMGIIHIHGKEQQRKFASQIGFQHPEKRAKLEKLIVNK